MHVVVLEPLVLVRMLTRCGSLVEIWHYKDAMLEIGLAQVESDHHLVTKWAELSVRGLVTAFIAGSV